jgi:hypothetical protein
LQLPPLLLLLLPLLLLQLLLLLLLNSLLQIMPQLLHVIDAENIPMGDREAPPDWGTIAVYVNCIIFLFSSKLNFDALYMYTCASSCSTAVPGFAMEWAWLQPAPE